MTTLSHTLAAGDAGQDAPAPHRPARGADASRHHPSPGEAVRVVPALFDWRADPTIAGCDVCHGTGRIPTLLGRIERCPCGARATS